MITVDTTLSQRYRLDALLGRGGMADVYRAHDVVLERPVAVKVMRGTGDDDARRFAHEVESMATLNHSGIVQLFDAGAHDGRPYLVMELVDGSPLSSVLEEGPLEPAVVQRIGGELAHALAHAHAQQVVHRDVKPANILVDASGSARLSDFGIAQLADATRITAPGLASGTAAYLAPEQLQGGDVGAGADVYALGLVLVEALTGRRDFTGSPMEAALARLHRDPAVPADLAPPWTPLLRAMTARDPAARPSAEEVVARISAAAPPRAAPTPAEPAAAHHAPRPAEPAATTAAHHAPTATIPPPPPADEPEPEPAAAAVPLARPRRTTVVGAVAILAVAVAFVVVGLSGDGAPVPDATDPAQAERVLPDEGPAAQVPTAEPEPAEDPPPDPPGPAPDDAAPPAAESDGGEPGAGDDERGPEGGPPGPDGEGPPGQRGDRDR